MGVPQHGLFCNGKYDKNGWFRRTPKYGNLHICDVHVMFTFALAETRQDPRQCSHRFSQSWQGVLCGQRLCCLMHYLLQSLHVPNLNQVPHANIRANLQHKISDIEPNRSSTRRVSKVTTACRRLKICRPIPTFNIPKPVGLHNRSSCWRKQNLKKHRFHLHGLRQREWQDTWGKLLEKSANLKEYWFFHSVRACKCKIYKERLHSNAIV